MTHRGRRLFSAFVVAAIVTTPASVAFARGPQCPPSVRLQPLPGDTTSEARGINNAGQVVGWSRGADHEEAVVWDADGTPRALRPLEGHHRAKAYAINAVGDVVGDSYGSGPTAVIWDADGNPTPLLPFNGDAKSSARGLNDAGRVVGYSHRPNANGPAGGLVLTPVVWDRHGNAEPLIMPFNIVEAVAAGISDSDQVVGYVSTRFASTAVSWHPGAATPLPALSPEQTSSKALAISASGLIAGESKHDDQGRGVAWAPGPRALRPLAGDSDSLVLAISDRGETVGHSTGHRGDRAAAWSVDGIPIPLSPLRGHTESQAFAINDAGKVAGVSIGESDHFAVVWDLRHCGR